MRASVLITWTVGVAAPTVGGAQTLDADTARALEAIGYLDRAPAANSQERGVTRNTGGAHPGVNLYSSRSAPTAELLSMDGELLHQWRDDRKAKWMHVELADNGNLLAIAQDRYLVRVDWNSNVVWRRTTRAHHDLDVDSEGRIYLLSRAVRFTNLQQQRVPILADKVEVLSPEGQLLEETWLHSLLWRFVPAGRRSALLSVQGSGLPVEDITKPDAPGDVTHVNSIAVLRDGLGQVAPPGSVLLSARELNRLFILDPYGPPARRVSSPSSAARPSSSPTATC